MCDLKMAAMWEKVSMDKDGGSIIPIERIQKCIYLIRGHKVLLDSDLAELYGTETKVLLQAVKRNIDRFPDDFMFQLDGSEFEKLRAQGRSDLIVRCSLEKSLAQPDRMSTIWAIPLGERTEKGKRDKREFLYRQLRFRPALLLSFSFGFFW